MHHLNSKDFKTKFLLTALVDVPFDGWTSVLMERTAKKLHIKNNLLHEAFPEGVKSLIFYFFDWATEETIQKLKDQNIERLRMRDRITLGVRTRLEILAPYKEAVSSSLSFFKSPGHALKIPKIIWHTADKIWWTAGDQSTDYNHYTKRILLSAVLASTTLYWLNDNSHKNEETWGFLDRRIGNVLNIGKLFSNFKKETAS